MEEANAKLLRVDAGNATGAGGVVWAQGEALAIDCVLDVPTSRHKYSLGARITDATSVFYIEAAEIDAQTMALLLDETRSRRLQVQADGRAARLWEVVAAVDHVDSDLGHLEIFVKGASA